MGSQRSFGTTTTLIIAAVVMLFVAAPVGFVVLASGSSCGDATAAGPEPSGAAKDGIPANYLRLYQASGRKYGLPWTLLAAIGKIETNHGRAQLPGVTSGQNFHGCCAGPMQFHNDYGRGGATWGAYKVDGNGDGRMNIYDPADAIYAAGNYLKALGADNDIERAIYGYNHSWVYVADVVAQMRRYGGQDATSLADPDNLAASANACLDGGGLLAGGGSGTYDVAPGANTRNGVSVPISADLDAFISRMASFYDGTIVLTTGTNHSQFSSSGLESDHWRGNGADFGMVLNGGTNGGPVGDRLAAAAYMAAGLPRAAALAAARAGGLRDVYTRTHRVQVIWKYEGHYDHVHVGLRRL